MDPFISIIFSLIGLAVAIVLIIAQCQLFAIRRYLHDLLEMQLALHGVTPRANIRSAVSSGGPVKIALKPLEVTLQKSDPATS